MTSQGPRTDAAVNSPAWWENYLAVHWDRNDGGGQTRHFMQGLIAALPAAEAEFLRSRSASVLDWGCAHGEGVDELARAFPQAKVAGLDVAASGIDTARQRFPQHEFLCTPGGTIPRRFDVVVTSNCLEHFSEPLAVLAPLAAATERFLIVLVPYAEEPLCEYHVVRFDEHSFPEQFAGLRKIATQRFATDPRYWAGEQLLVVYATPRYQLERGRSGEATSERDKWNSYYAGREPAAEPAEIAEFNAEFAALIDELLPQGGRTLEAGAGDGWQSLALARQGKFAVSLLDFAEEALRHAQTRFAAAGLRADFALGDASAVGQPEFDLVFNAGVLEHFGFDEQVRFVRGMASRSRRYVLSLVPNRRCTWYWLWRLQVSRRSAWPYGGEYPAVELASVFRAAGLRVLGERVLGASWAERFITGLAGADAELLRELLTLHRAPILGDEAKGYLLATLAEVADAPPSAAPSGWQASAASGGRHDALLAGALADALALQMTTQSKLVQVEQMHRDAAARAESISRQAEQQHRDATRELLAAQTSRAELQVAHAELQTHLRARSADADRLAAELVARGQELASERAAREQLSKQTAALEAEIEAMRRWAAEIRGSRTMKLLRLFDRVSGRERRPE